MKKLPRGQAKKLVIEGHSLDMTVRQISEKYGISVATVRNVAARMKIKIRMQPRGQYDKSTKTYFKLPAFPEDA